MLKQIPVAYDFYFRTNCKFGYKEPPILPNFQDQKVKENKTLIKKSRFKAHKKIEELRLQASHITFKVRKFLYNTIKHLEKFPMCIWRASSIIFLGVKICQNTKCFSKKKHIQSQYSLSLIGNNHQTSKKYFVKFSPILDSDFSLVAS
jgi:hypothetical protein